MKSTISAMCASLLAISVSAAAQSATPPPQPTPTTPPHTMDQKEMTVSGCLEKTKSGGFWLTMAMPVPAAMTTPNTPPAPGTPTARPADIVAMKGMTYNLENGKDLDNHVGHKIEVSGHVQGQMSGDHVRGAATEGEMQAHDFDVKSVKMIAPSCP